MQTGFFFPESNLTHPGGGGGGVAAGGSEGQHHKQVNKGTSYVLERI